ncbi:MAG: glycosyltransferase family 39 protein [Anaerolineales bacterium]|nr:glycosyltransferase family 39 protein [Anaerolineales bacterium]
MILLLAAGLRFYHLDSQSFWNDEGNSARLSERSVRLIIEGTASDIHPPLYYLLLRGWRELVGASEFGLRAFSAFLGVGLTALTLALGRRWFGAERDRPVPFLAALLVALNPTLIYYSQETRMYLLLPFLATLQTILLWRWQTAGRPRTRLLAAYVLVAAAGLYTHYAYPLLLLAHNGLVAFWLWRRWRGQWRPRLGQWAGMMVVALLLYAPWLPIFLRQAGGRSGESIGLFSFARDLLAHLLLGRAFAGSLWYWLLPLALLLTVAIWRRQVSGYALWLGLTPLILLWLVGTTGEPFYKFGLLLLPPLLLGLAAGALTLLPRWPVAWLGAIVLLPFLWQTAISLDRQYHDPAYARADYRAMAARIAAEAHPNAGIILNAANQWEVFTYYYAGPAPVYPLPRGAIEPAALTAELDELLARHDRLYAIFWGEAGRDPERLVERQLDEAAFKAVDEWYGDVRFVMYAVPPADLAALLQPVPLPPGGALFGEQIRLTAAGVPAAPLRAGDILPIQLTWSARTPITERYKIFLHLVGPDGQIVAQRDSEPGGGLALTDGWEPGAVIVDNHGIFLPLELPPGQYTLRLGLYALTDPNRRLPLSDGADWLELAQFQIEANE